MNFFTGARGTKRLDLLRQIVPNATKIGVLVQPNTPQTEAEHKELEATAQGIGQQLLVLRVSDAQEIKSAISRLVEWGAGALLVGSGPFLYSNRQIIIDEVSVITCPACGYSQTETMPTNACVFFYDCPGCKTRLKRKQGDCCLNKSQQSRQGNRPSRGFSASLPSAIKARISTHHGYIHHVALSSR